MDAKKVVSRPREMFSKQKVRVNATKHESTSTHRCVAEPSKKIQKAKCNVYFLSFFQIKVKRNIGHTTGFFFWSFKCSVSLLLSCLFVISINNFSLSS